MARGKPLTDKDIAALVGARVRPCNTFTDTTLSKEREELSRYYDAQEPAPLHRGNSKYVSQDVFDSVEMAKAILLETFVGNDQPVRFRPDGADDVRQASIATTFTNHVVFTQNDGYSVFHDVIHDGLMNRAGIAQVLWKEDKEEVEEEMQNVAPDAASVLLEQANGTVKEIRLNEEDGTIDIVMTREIDRSRVVIEAVPPEEFGMSPRAKSLKDANVVFRSCRMTRSEMRKNPDFDQKVVEDVSSNPSSWDSEASETQQRFSDTDDGLDNDRAWQDATETIRVFTVFTKLDVDGSGIAKLWKICWAGGQVLYKERCQRVPFLLYTPLRKPHSAWGSSYAKRVQAIQNARTMLTRAIIDHSLITTNPRHTVVRGALVNPKELLENRLGGVVNVTRHDAVAPLLNPPLNPFVLQTIGLLDDDKEKNTGVSQLSQGLNKDAISKQNSADLVQAMVTVSQQRQKIMARNFAYGFLSELFLLVYELVLENQNYQTVIEIAGDWVPVDPASWRARSSVSVEFHLGHQEKEREFVDLVQIDQYFRNTPGLAGQYQPPQQYALITRALALKGIRDVNSYLLPPGHPDIPEPQPDPLKVAEMQLKEREVAVKEALAGIQKGKVQTEAQRKIMETQLKTEREAHKVSLDQSKLGLQQSGQQLKEAEFMHQREVDQAEIALDAERVHNERLSAQQPPSWQGPN